MRKRLNHLVTSLVLLIPMAASANDGQLCLAQLMGRSVSGDKGVRQRLAHLYLSHEEFRDYIEGYREQLQKVLHFEVALDFINPESREEVKGTRNNERTEILSRQMELLSHLDPRASLPKLVTETFPLMVTACRHPMFRPEQKARLVEVLDEMLTKLRDRNLSLNAFLEGADSLDPLKALIKDLNASDNYAIWL